MYHFRFRFGFWCCRAFWFMSGRYRIYRFHFRVWVMGFPFRVPLWIPGSGPLSRSGVGFGTCTIWSVLPVAGYSCLKLLA